MPVEMEDLSRNLQFSLNLNTDDVRAMNVIAAYLALDNLSSEPNSTRADLVILAGNALLATVEGACELARAQNLPVLFSGGIGHSAPFLRAAISAHPTYNRLETALRSEASIMGEMARRFWRLPDERVLTETASANCGENGLFTRRLLDGLHIDPQIVILIQDPLMQRRTDAAFRHAWRDSRRPPRFLNWPVFVPQLEEQQGSLRYAGSHPGSLWSIDRYISLLMGEIPRLRDDEQGYGPHGRGFIPHVDIPDEVEAAYRHVARSCLRA